MKRPDERRPYDVTRLPPTRDLPPPVVAAGARPVRGSVWARLRAPAAHLTGVVLPAAGLWLRRPLTRIFLFVLLTGLTVGVVAARSRPPSVDGPALATTGWHATASGMGAARRNAPDPGAALDGNPETRWTTGRGQRNSDWFAVDMGKKQTFHQVVLDAGKNADEWPRAYAVYVSGDGVRWGASVARGEGHGPVTVIGFARQTARYVKVVQTGQDRQHPWTLGEFTVH